MDKPIKIKGSLVGRLDRQCKELSLSTLQNLANTVMRKGLDFLENFGYDELLKIPAKQKKCTEDISSSGAKA